MLTLALSTSTRRPAAALLRGGELLGETEPGEGAPASARFPAQVRELLVQTGVDPAAVELLVVCTGPGSFTGLRIGLAMARAWSWAAGCPLVGVPALDVMAFGASHRQEAAGPGKLRVAIDAQRGEFHVATWALPQSGPWCGQDPELASGSGLVEGLGAEDLLVLPPGHPPPGDPHDSAGRWPRVLHSQPEPHDLGLLGQRLFDERGPDETLLVLPVYGRPSAAEEKRLSPRQGQ